MGLRFPTQILKFRSSCNLSALDLLISFVAMKNIEQEQEYLSHWVVAITMMAGVKIVLLNFRN